jgi:hypothetical protein
MATSLIGALEGKPVAGLDPSTATWVERLKE